MIECRAPRAAPFLPPGRSLVADLLVSSVIPPASWAALPAADRGRIECDRDPLAQLAAMVGAGLLTEYQARRIGEGDWNGLVLGNYRILDRVGSGGSGVVYRAEHRLMGRPAAVKVLKRTAAADDPALVRFFAEIRALSRLRHPNVAAALDAGEVPGRTPGAEKAYYLVMEYVEGQDLDAHVRDRGPLPAGRACEVVYELAEALAEAHRHDLVHRDVKPSNVRIAPDGRAVLLDFGLALCPQHRQTRPGVPLGTPEYMAPEQVRDAAASDARTDVYGLGGVLFWCLTGRPPFPGHRNVFQSMMARVTQAPPSARLVRPELPAYLDAVLSRAMATDPRHRFPTAAALAGALAHFMAQVRVRT